MSEKDNVFDYVMNSPEDTNPSVLRSLLNDIPEGGGGSQELPTPSVDNVGKVATVVSDGQGGYEWGASYSDFMITVNAAEGMQDLTADKSVDEMIDAINVGKNILIKFINSEEYDVISLGGYNVVRKLITGHNDGVIFDFLGTYTSQDDDVTYYGIFKLQLDNHSGSCSKFIDFKSITSY